ncbi:inositol monophosphatase family protein [Lacisediminihabitans sp.]|uniref:inositol monophosphatase family protein n=1 Tax=Lacisediminihabitans sp. TaxID=2787631 RepID=UPI00374D5E1F
MTVESTNAALLAVARDVAIEAGKLARRRRSEGVQVAASKSSLEDVVTLADRETEALIRARLFEARGDDGFFGEESAAGSGSSGLTWIVDPIDGTVNYLYGIPHYAVSIAVVEGEPDPATWRALAGVVINPATGEVFSATDGGGARLGDRPIAVAPPVELSQALVGTGFAYLAAIRAEQAAVLVGLIDQVRDIRRMGTASLDLCAVACGRLNAYYERQLSPWDHAAGALIAREAGARVGGLRGAAASREFVLAGEPALAARLEDALIRLGA